MKKTIAFFLLALILLAFAACKKADPDTDTSTTKGNRATTSTADVSGESNTNNNQLTIAALTSPSETQNSDSPFRTAENYSRSTFEYTNANQQQTAVAPPPKYGTPPENNNNNANANNVNNMQYTNEKNNLSIDYATRKREIESQHFEEKKAELQASSEAQAKIVSFQTEQTRLQNQKTAVKSEYDRELSRAYANSGGQESSYVRTVRQQYEAQLQDIDNQISAYDGAIRAQSDLVNIRGQADANYQNRLNELESWHTAELNRINQKYGK